jgi:hypothetical protein
VALEGELGVALPLEPTTGALITTDYGIVAAIENDVVCRWVNDKAPGTSAVVLTDGPAGDQPGIYYVTGDSLGASPQGNGRRGSA